MNLDTNVLLICIIIMQLYSYFDISKINKQLKKMIDSNSIFSEALIKSGLVENNIEDQTR